MRIQTSPKRTVATTLATSVLITGMLTASAAASGTTYACVKRTSGATRIVGAKTKCRHSEQKLSWSTAGTAGKNGAQGPAGAQGAEGRAGANGAAVVFAGTDFAPHALLEKQATTVITKVVPPGSYSVFARTVLRGEAAKAAFAEAVCELGDQPGTAGAEEGTLLDLVGWAGPLGEKEPNEFLAEAPISLQGTVASAVTSTLELLCFNDSATSLTANDSQLQGLSVTRIG